MYIKLSVKRTVYSIIFIFALWGCASPAMTPDKRGESLPVTTKSFLPNSVNETSGLALIDNTLWTMNDSGGAPALYGFDRGTDQIKAVVKIKGAKNIDWESLAQDQDNLYIADCGNNKGKRKVLDLYTVDLKDLVSVSQAADQNRKVVEASAKASKSHFAYGDYSESSGGAYTTNFDCEAIASVDGRIWLFSKNWGDLQTRLYILDSNVSMQTVQPVMVLPVGGMITGADFNPDGQQLVLLGYSKVSAFGYSFIWLIDVKDGFPDWEHARYHRLQTYAQWEGISWNGDKALILSSESSPLGKQQIAVVNLP